MTRVLVAQVCSTLQRRIDQAMRDAKIVHRRAELHGRSGAKPTRRQCRLMQTLRESERAFDGLRQRTRDLQRRAIGKEAML